MSQDISAPGIYVYDNVKNIDYFKDFIEAKLYSCDMFMHYT